MLRLLQVKRCKLPQTKRKWRLSWRLLINTLSFRFKADDIVKGLWLDKLNKSLCVQTSRFLISAMLQYLYCKFTTICLHFFPLWFFDASWVPGGLNACLSFTAAGPAASKCSFLCSSCSRFPFFNVHLSSDQVPCLLNPPTDVLSSEAAKPHTAKEQYHVF